MIVLSYITNIIFIISSLFALFCLLKKYKEGLEDSQAIINFAIGEILLVISFFIYLTCDIIIYYTSQLALSMHILDTLIFFIQCRGAILLNNFFYKEKNITTSFTGIIFMTFFMLIIASLGLFVTCDFTLLKNGHGLYGLQVTGMKIFDGYAELIHIIFCFLIFAFIPGIKKLILLRTGFIFIAASELVQLLNVMSFNYTDVAFFYIEWGLAIIGIICLNSVYFVLNKNQKSYYYFID